jgi:hypothetical protein
MKNYSDYFLVQHIYWMPKHSQQMCSFYLKAEKEEEMRICKADSNWPMEDLNRGSIIRG